VSVVSPLNVAQFPSDLVGHPDRQAVSFVLQGLGFKPAHRLKAAKWNKPSAFQNPQVIDRYLTLKVSRCSFGDIPKKGQPGKWRLIINLSSPGGYSVNDGISADEFSMHYITLDQIIRMVAKRGPGAMMAKFDVEAAYHNVAVHPEDR